MYQTRTVIRMIPALLLALAVAVHAVVLPTEAGDMFYFSFGGVAGAVDAFGRVLWSVPGQLIASDPMGSCLAVASAAYNQSASPPAFLGTAVSLYTPDGRLLWSAVVKLNATALATDCVSVAVGGQNGEVAVLKDGKVVQRINYTSPVYALAYKMDGALAVGTGGPLTGFTAYVDRCGDSVTALKTDAPYLIVSSPRFGSVKYMGGLAPMLRPPAGVSEDCRTFAYAVYDAVYNNTSPLVKLPEPVISLAASGDGSLGGTEAAEGEAAGGAGTPRERRRDAEYGTDAPNVRTARRIILWRNTIYYHGDALPRARGAGPGSAVRRLGWGRRAPPKRLA